MKTAITVVMGMMFVIGAWAQPVPALYEGADLKLGEKLIAESKCTACHQKSVGGDGSAMYKRKGHVSDLGALRGMVEACNLKLNLGLFPEDVTSIAAVLNRDYYKFK